MTKVLRDKCCLENLLLQMPICVPLALPILLAKRWKEKEMHKA